MKRLLMSALIVLAASISTAGAQGADGGEDEQAIRKTITDYAAAFNAKDAKRFLDFQTADEDGRDPRDGRFMPKRTLSQQQEGFSTNPRLH